VLIWPVGTTDETKAIVTELLQQLEGASPTELAEIEQTLAQMPTPHPAISCLCGIKTSTLASILGNLLSSLFSQASPSLDEGRLSSRD